MEAPSTANHYSPRIACLIPSATAICLALGLKDYIVGVTHECPDIDGKPFVLTKNGLSETYSQAEIHRAVQTTAGACSGRSSKGGDSDDRSALLTEISYENVPSLYPLLEDQMKAARPNIIFTQKLCSVCAPTEDEVKELLTTTSHDTKIQVISLQPTTLDQVAETFLTIAKACGVQERGQALQTQWLEDFQRLQSTIMEHRLSSHVQPRMLILEWLDPPFDGGHWTYQMMEYACVANAADDKKGPKSTATTWSSIEQMDPDVILVGCCGFGLERNVQDIHLHAGHLQKLRAARQLFACNGNNYIAMPAPTLLQGAVIMAKCAYQDQPRVLEAIDDLKFFSAKQEDLAWKRVNLPSTESSHSAAALITADMEDMVTENGFARLHQEACERGESTYMDPETGYSVFTAVAHKNRGWCCGSGCRHCPFSHENVKDKAVQIQQPAILYQPNDDDSETNPLVFSVNHHPTIKILFFSGGKDSFLTIRALARQFKNAERDDKFGLVLLTTFDASSRMIAHQDIPIDDIIHQARHLKIELLGIPLRRGSGETYQERVQMGLSVIQDKLPPSTRISRLVFGDLHLEHIKEWRDSSLMALGYELEYALWKVPYPDLMKDLEESQVPCYISGTTVDSVPIGVRYDRELYEKASALGLDGFGENGEFHSIARVWEVPRETALGV